MKIKKGILTLIVSIKLFIYSICDLKYIKNFLKNNFLNITIILCFIFALILPIVYKWDDLYKTEMGCTETECEIYKTKISTQEFEFDKSFKFSDINQITTLSKKCHYPWGKFPRTTTCYYPVVILKNGEDIPLKFVYYGYNSSESNQVNIDYLKNKRFE